MPELTERKLLCRTCGLPGERDHHNAECTCGDDLDGRYPCIYSDGVLADGHPFDGVPYVRCSECRDGYVPRGWAFGGVSSWDVCSVCAGTPGWVREDAADA